MGRDKALLPFRGSHLAEFVARTVEAAAGAAVLVGDPTRYREFPYPVIADLHPGEGPLGGILTALHHTSADWNLVVACDMPGLAPEFLTRLLDTAAEVDADALVPAGPSGIPQPLCAVYHRRALAALEQEFGAGQRKVTAALARLNSKRLPIGEGTVFQNVNTPEDWAVYGRE
jgi:molybdopterin-guanine dinucleotide biosynthesis protein A